MNRAVKKNEAKAPKAKPSSTEIKPSSTEIKEAAQVSAEQQAGFIARAAYFHAERRGFAPGKEMQDWLAAEKEIAESIF
jgi:hypothetical protein